jgi:hypothetical protein
VKKIALKTVEFQVRNRRAVIKKITCPACRQTVEAEVIKEAEPVELDYADSLLNVLDMPPSQTGFNGKILRERLPIIHKIERAQAEGADQLLLEDAQHKLLTPLVETYPGFRYQHQAILDFIEDVKCAPPVPVEEAKAAENE